MFKASPSKKKQRKIDQHISLISLLKTFPVSAQHHLGITIKRYYSYITVYVLTPPRKLDWSTGFIKLIFPFLKFIKPMR